jgi:Mg2+/Co2+ transporter CorB
LNDLSTGLLLGCIVFLLVLSAFFSASETGLLSLNRYRLKHLAKNNHRAARRAQALLEQPEKMLGTILIGNNVVNILASAIATVLAIRVFGDAGILVVTVVFTIIVIIFSEITPKTIAALYPERIAFPATLPLKGLLTILSPLSSIINQITRQLLRLFRMDPQKKRDDRLSSEELRTIVHEAGDRLPSRHQGMLLNILDLETATIDDIMIPRGEIFAIDIDDSEEKIMQALANCPFTRIPVYHEDINNIIGILHMRNLGKLLAQDNFSKELLREILREPLYVPECTGLHTQLVNFQKGKRRIAMVVDEYGTIMGLVTMEDILEEIVGEFTSNLTSTTDEIEPQQDGSFLVDGSATIRELNRKIGLKLPTSGPKTLNGLCMEQLESFPDGAAAIRIGTCVIEIVEIRDNVVERARISKRE